MSSRSWIGKVVRARFQAKAKENRTPLRAGRGFRPRLEMLEDRLTPAAFVVSSTGDLASDPSTLRYALAHLTPGSAASANSITFAAGLSGQTISLAVANGGEMAINQGVTIVGLGVSQLSVSGSNTSRVFRVNAGINVSISSLTIKNGYTTNTFGGGAISNSGTLSLTSVAVINSIAQGGFGANSEGGGGGGAGLGGGIFNGGTLNLVSSTLSGNQAIGGQGGVGQVNATNGKGGQGGGSSGGEGGLQGSSDPGEDGGYASGGGGGGYQGGAGGSGGFGGGGGGGGDGPSQVGGGSSFGGGRGGAGDTTGYSGGGGGGGGGGFGGAVFNAMGGIVTITNCNLASNSAIGGAGGVALTGPNHLGKNRDGSGGIGYGGAVFSNGGSITITSSTFTSNAATGTPGDRSAAGSGGAVFNLVASTATISTSTFTSNSSTSRGGAIVNSGTMTLTGTAIVNSNAQGAFGNNSEGGGGGGAGLGGGVYNSGTLNLVSSTLSGNRALGGQGGVGQVNQTNGSGGKGGGPRGGTGAVRGASVSGYGGGYGSGGGGGSYQGGAGGAGGFGGGGGGGGDGPAKAGGAGGFGGGSGGVGDNTGYSGGGGGGGGAGLGGAIFNASAGTVTITNSTLAGNIAIGGNGGVALDGPNHNGTNVGGNGGSGFGAAVFSNGGSVTVVSSTIASNATSAGSGVNSGGNSGGGIFITNSGTLTIKNSIVSANTSSTQTLNNIDINSGTLTNNGYNLLGPGISGTGFDYHDQITNSPSLAALGNYGGATQTMALLPGSPAVGNGVQSSVGFDQRGIARPGVGAVDIGAYEYTTASTVTLANGDVSSLIAYLSPGTTSTINLASGGTYSLVAVNNTLNGASGLPAISKTVTVNGNGATISRDPAVSNFRLFSVNGGQNGFAIGTLTLNGLTLQFGLAQGTNSTTVDGGLGGGGAILNQGTLTVSGVTFTNNQASGGNGLNGGAGWGGAILNSFGTATVTNSTFTNNKAQGGSATGNSSTVGGAGQGGAIFNYNGSLTLLDNTIAGNFVVAGTAAAGLAGPANGGAVYNLAAGNNSNNTGGVTSSLTLTNNILAGSLNGSGTTVSDLVSSRQDGTFTNTATLTATLNAGLPTNLEQNGAFTIVNGAAPVSVASQFVVGNPGLSALANNGGLTQTMAITTASPAFNVGYNAGVPAGVTTDQRGMGFSRIVGPRVDIGAFELVVAPTITTANSTTFLVGSNGLFTFSTIGAPVAVLSKGSFTLPTGVTFTDRGDGTATLSGSPAAGTGGTYTFTVTANNGVTPDATQSFTLTVNEAPIITSANNTAFKVGSAGTFTVTTGHSFPTAVTLSANGTLGGMTFVDNRNGTATLSGTPTAGSGGTFQFTITASNGISPNAVQTFTLTVNEAPSITSANNTTFTVGRAGTFTVTTGHVFPTAVALSASGSLGGMSFVDNHNGTATLSGTPAAGAGGTYQFTITANNGVTPNAVQTFTLTVNKSPSITSANNTTFTVGTAGTFSVTTGHAYPTATALSASGSLGGMSFVDNHDGTATLSGTPTAGSGGAFQFTITASNGISPNATQTFTLTVNEAPSITSANNTTFAVGTPGTFTVTTGHDFPVATTLSASGSLGGMSFVENHDGTATLSGTPTAGSGGTFQFTITASNGISPNATQTFTLTVNEAPSITSANNTTFTVGTTGTFTITTGHAFPTAVALSASGSLGGMSFVDNHNGTATLSGTPAPGAGGTYQFTITANNGVTPNAVQTFTLTVNEAPSITSANNTTFMVGTAGTFSVTTGHAYPTATALSASGSLGGMSFVDNHNGTATLSGTPAAGTGGTFSFTITASNGVAPNATQNFTLTVNEAPSITSANNTTFTVGTAGTFTVTTGHDFPTATTLIASGSLGGMSFVDNHNGTATLSGTPAAGTGATYQFTITASNGILPNAVQLFTLTVAQAAAITSTDTTSFIVGAANSFTVTATGFGTPALSVDGNNLPAGLSFTDNGDGTATLSGTAGPVTAGHYSLTIRAHNGVGSDALQTFTLIIHPVPPTVTSPTVSSLGSLTATLGGNVTSVGGGPLTKRGIVYAPTATNSNPTIGGSGVIEVDDSSATSGVFSEVINGLKPGTSYTFSAFATNGLTSYTAPVSFTTTRAASSGISGLSNALAGQSIPFSLSASDPVARWQSYYFVFRIKWGDGTTSTVTALNGSTTNHTFANPGTYSVQVTATDGGGTVLPVGTMSIVIKAHAALEDDVLFVTGGSGSDTIALSTPTVGVVGIVVNGVSQGTFAPRSVVILSSGGTDTLVGPDAVTPTVWTLTGAKSGSLSNSGLTASFVFNGVTNLSGGTGTDIFAVQNAASGFGSLNGGGGQNSLDYSQVSSAVTVNLLTRSATKFSSVAGFNMVVGGSGNDRLTADNMTAVTLVGGTGNDTLTGGVGASVLLGGAGDDVLLAGSGRSLLVGGSGADRLTGGANDSILIGGLLSYYDEDAEVVDVARLNSIMKEWLRTDLDFTGRVTDLENGTGLNGVAVLNAATIRDDGVIDSLFGGSGADWFLLNDSDALSGNKASDVVTNP